jgi:sugar phosphate isomerase/epimerase
MSLIPFAYALPRAGGAMIKGIAINCHDDFIDGSLERLGGELAKAEESGFDAYEISALACDVIRNGLVDRAILGEVRAVLSSYRLRYTMHGPNSLRLNQGTGFHERAFLSCLEYAHAIGAEVLVYHSAQMSLRSADQELGGLPSPEELEESWDIETQALRRVGARAEELGVLIGVENRDPHLWELAALKRNGRDPGELADYHQGMRLDLLAEQVREVNSPSVGICLDVGHAFLAAPYCPRGYLDQIRGAAPWVRHLHWHDNFGKLDDRCDSLAERLVFGEADCHLPPGTGSIPLGEVWSLLAGAGYDGWMTVEVRPRYADRIGSIPGTIRQALSI